MLKRAFSSAVVSSILLGTSLSPVTFAAAGSNGYQMTKKQISFNGKVISNPMGIAAKDPSTKKDTTFMPFFYLKQALSPTGVTIDYKGNTLTITPPDSIKPDLTKVQAGHGAVQIAIHGTVVTSGPKLVAKDPYSGVDTTYVPVWYIEQALNRLGIHSTWDGTHWDLTLTQSPPTPPAPPTPQVGSLTITGNQTIGMGTPDPLTLEIKDTNGQPITPASGSVTWSVDDTVNGFITPSRNFLATKAGTYTVTAKYGSVTQSFKITVYGATASLHLAASGDLVADGKSTQTVNVTALDENGNTALGENGTVVVSVDKGLLVTGTTNGVNTLGRSVSVTLKNGVGTAVLQSPTTSGVTVNLTTTGLSDPASGAAINYGTTSITSVAQVATALKVAPANGEQYLVANQGGTTVSLYVTVVDQAGSPMLTGTYPYSILVSGTGAYTGPVNGLYVAGTTSLPIVVASKQGVTGPAVVTVSANGLSVGTCTIQAVIAQNASKLNAAPVGSGSASFSEGAPVLFNLTAIDPNGYPTSFPATPLTVYVSNSQGLSASNILVNGSAVSANGVPLNSAQSLSISDSTIGPDAGSYTVTIKDSAGNTWAQFPVTETATAAGKLSVRAQDSEVAIANPTTTLTVQYTDSYGNPATMTAVPSITLIAVGGQGGATINGQDATKGVKITPDASGKATAVFTAQPYAGNTWSITATDGSLTSASTTVSVLNALVTNAFVSIKDVTTGSLGQATAGDNLQFTFSATDSYGNTYIGNDIFAVTFPAGSLSITAGTTANGITTVTGTLDQLRTTFQSVQVAAAQNLSVQIADQSVSSAKPGSAGLAVTPGTFFGFAFFTLQNQLISAYNGLAVAADAPVQVWLRPVDQYGNPVPVATTSYAVDLLDNSNGSFRLSPTGQDITRVTFTAGAGSVPIYYVNGSGTYTLTADISKLSAEHCTVAVSSFTPFKSSGSVNGTGTLTVTLRDRDGQPFSGEAANLTATASIASVTVGSFTESSTNPGTYTAAVTSTSNNSNVTITVKDGASTTIGTTSGFNS